MITGTPIKEKEYRLREELSQSMLKEFADDRKKFYRKYIAKESVDDDDPDLAIKMGHLVDCLWLTRDEFDEKFMMSVCPEAPTALMLKFCQELAIETKHAMDEEGVMQSSFAEMAIEAHRRSGYKWSIDKVLEKFEGKDPENYYKELVAAQLHKKLVVTQQQVDNAERIVAMIVTGEFTGPLFRTTDDNITRYNQYPVVGFSVNGVLCKALLDQMEINDEERYIQPWDLKCTWAVENWYEEYYLKRKGHLQAAMYDAACKHIRDTYYPDYEVRPIKFLATDSIGYYRPLIYTLTEMDLWEANQGFVHKGRRYKGLFALIQELNWSLMHNIWDISMENHDNQGVVPIQSLRRP